MKPGKFIAAKLLLNGGHSGYAASRAYYGFMAGVEGLVNSSTVDYPLLITVPGNLQL